MGRKAFTAYLRVLGTYVIDIRYPFLITVPVPICIFISFVEESFASLKVIYLIRECGRPVKPRCSGSHNISAIRTIFFTSQFTFSQDLSADCNSRTEPKTGGAPLQSYGYSTRIGAVKVLCTKIRIIRIQSVLGP